MGDRDLFFKRSLNQSVEAIEVFDVSDKYQKLGSISKGVEGFYVFSPEAGSDGFTCKQLSGISAFLSGANMDLG